MTGNTYHYTAFLRCRFERSVMCICAMEKSLERDHSIVVFLIVKKKGNIFWSYFSVEFGAIRGKLCIALSLMIDPSHLFHYLENENQFSRFLGWKTST